MDKKQELGNRDEREKARALTPAEQKRLEKFETLAAHMIEEGYSRVELTVGIVKANVFAVVLLIPLFIVGYGLFLLKNRTFGGGFTPLSMLLLALATEEKFGMKFPDGEAMPTTVGEVCDAVLKALS